MRKKNYFKKKRATWRKKRTATYRKKRTTYRRKGRATYRRRRTTYRRKGGRAQASVVLRDAEKLFTIKAGKTWFYYPNTVNYSDAFGLKGTYSNDILHRYSDEYRSFRMKSRKVTFLDS